MSDVIVIIHKRGAQPALQMAPIGTPPISLMSFAFDSLDDAISSFIGNRVISIYLYDGITPKAIEDASHKFYEALYNASINKTVPGLHYVAVEGTVNEITNPNSR